MKRRWLLLLGLSLALMMALGPDAVPTVAQADDAFTLIDQVNQLRRARGLPAYQVNPKLMAIAQAHSEYQAAIGSVTHTGKGGTRPRDRAIAAGYGGGGTVFVSENISGGTNLAARQAVTWWQGDAPHLNTMLGSNYREVGAGVATAGNFVYYTLDVGYVAGAAGPVSSSSADDPAVPSVPAPAPPAVSSVQVAGARADGSIVHEVQPGQTLIGIATAYKLKLAELLELNELGNNTFIYPGDKLIIQPAHTATPTATVTATPTPTQRPTLAATYTPPVVKITQALPTDIPEPEQPPPVFSQALNELIQSERGPTLVGVVLVALISLITPLLIALRRKV